MGTKWWHYVQPDPLWWAWNPIFFTLNPQIITRTLSFAKLLARFPWNMISNDPHPTLHPLTQTYCSMFCNTRHLQLKVFRYYTGFRCQTDWYLLIPKIGLGHTPCKCLPEHPQKQHEASLKLISRGMFGVYLFSYQLSAHYAGSQVNLHLQDRVCGLCKQS